jgi:hypothetical protein
MARTGGNQPSITENHYCLRYNPIESQAKPDKCRGTASNLMKAKVELTMHPLTRSLKATAYSAVLILTVCSSGGAWAESCQTSDDMDIGVRNAIVAAGQRYFTLLANGDVAGLRQNAIPSLASDFLAVETTVKSHQAELTGAQATPRPVFLLEADGPPPKPHSEFYCGVFGKSGQTANSAIFYLDNLPPAKYAVIILDTTSAKGRTSTSMILQQVGTDWKLGGLFVKLTEVNGHDSQWFVTQARAYKTKGQAHNAWFYYMEARSLISPLPFMSTATTDKLYDESQALQPADMPGENKPADLAGGGATYKVTAVFPEMVGTDLDLIVKYQAADVSNTNTAYQGNVAVMKAFVTKYPELRDAFGGLVARAVDPSGRDYGTMLAMKDIK